MSAPDPASPSPSPSPTPPAASGLRRARRWEERVQRAAHPIAYPLLAHVPGPVRRLPGIGVVVTDPRMLRTVLMDGAAFSKTGPGASSELWTPVLGPSVLLNMHGEDHLALRRQLAPLFAPAFVDALVAESLGGFARDLEVALSSGRVVDLVGAVRSAAGSVVSRLVGLAPGVLDDRLAAEMQAITGFVSLARPRLTPPQLARARAALGRLDEHARVAYAGDESTVPGRMRALGLTEREALGAVGAFVLTGTETIVSFLPRLAAILLDTGWLPRLEREPQHRDAAVAEALRVTTPTPVMVRSVTAPARIGDLDVRVGERVVLVTFRADRALGEFDPEGNPGAQLKQLWFGAGAHFCIGAPLAMAQIRLVLDALLAAQRERGLRVVGRRAQRGVLIPAYARLELRAGSR